jgi:hypothetical protein
MKVSPKGSHYQSIAESRGRQDLTEFQNYSRRLFPYAKGPSSKSETHASELAEVFFLARQFWRAGILPDNLPLAE